jgi:hypothetical protein
MANQTLNVRIADPKHPNNYRYVGGVIFSHSWKRVTVSDANAAKIVADASLETDASALTGAASTALAPLLLDAVSTTVGEILDGLEVDDSVGSTIIARTVAVYRKTSA